MTSSRPVDPTWRPYLRVTTQEEVDQERHDAEEASRQWRAAQAATEQAQVDAALAAGATFIVNIKGDNTPVVHTLDCQHARDKLDRQATWDAYAHPSAGSPRGIEVLTRTEVEALRRYQRCGTCSPEVASCSGAHRPDSILAQSLHARHVGQRVVAADGTDLGILEEIEQIVVIRTDTGQHLIPARERVRIQEKE